MMTIEVWETEDEITVFPATHSERDKNLLLGDLTFAQQLRTISGETWEDCMKEHYRIMGWGEYVPCDCCSQ